MRLEVSEVIVRPPAVVFQFVAAEHVQNHPRWDPAMSLEQLSDGPIGVGTLIRRRHTRAGAPIEGTMEVVEYEPDRAMATLIHDGQVEMHGRMQIERVGERQSRLTISVEVPGAPNPLDPMPVEESLRRIKALIESER